MAMLRSLLLLFIVFSMGNAQVNLSRKCPYGWINFGVRCFKFFSSTVHWVTAEKNCQSLGANLASIHSKIEQEFLLSLLPSSSTRCWIGTHDGNHEGQWLWTDGTPYDFAYFGPGQPDNLGEENCGELNFTANRWNDADCLTSLPYLCAQNL
ncbi:galactose-specific lectin nattectin-like isoform X2 [Labeo rohita]|uniref:galactose-specific lectin nattectin-like isoform X2 n=1 Tax=Labeo rohita TaxID=84645 RepID=UPI0021E21B5D|nr:galactose-specific lectin nattectin-like isoform X2 [Labeo rohita]